MLVKSTLGFSLILGTCAVIFVGVAGGYRSPLATSTDAAADATIADTHGGSLLRTASFPATSSQGSSLLVAVSPPR